MHSPGEEASKTREQENTAMRLPQDIHISSVSVTVLNCNYVLVHAVIEQGIGESGGWTLSVGRFGTTTEVKRRVETQLCFLIFLKELA